VAIGATGAGSLRPADETADMRRQQAAGGRGYISGLLLAGQHRWSRAANLSCQGISLSVAFLLLRYLLGVQDNL
jgi:hypothetical protein